MSKVVHLGYEVGTGEAIAIPVKHMVVSGQTQESGKTTTLEALISRAGLPAIAFLTKRGEASLSGRPILPYFRERADWQFVESILESTMKERKKFERPWIVRACEGASTLADVARRLPQLQAKAKNSLSQDMYMLLGEYLKRVVPQIAELPKADEVEIGAGLAVMDLVRYPEELQMLVIASTLEWIHRRADGVITIIPEAWKFIPQGKNTPVKVVAEKLVREGAGLRNYLWIDSQDLAGVEKLLLRGCAVWLLGVQREVNEVKRGIANMPEGTKRPKPGDVATLALGEFFACYARELRRVYVQPAWMDNTTAKRVSQGLHVAPARLQEMKAAYQWQAEPGREYRKPAQTSARFTDLEIPIPAATEDTMPKQFTEDELMQHVPASSPEYNIARRLIRMLLPFLNGAAASSSPAAEPADAAGPTGGLPSASSPHSPANGRELIGREQNPLEAIVARAVEQIRRDPVLVKLSQDRPTIEVKVNKSIVAMEDSSLKGKIAGLIHEGFFRQPRPSSEIRKELIRRGVDSRTGNVIFGNAYKSFVEMGFFFVNGEEYELAPGARSRVVQQ